MHYLINHLFKLVLSIFSDGFSDTVDKSLKFSQTSTNKSLELFSCDRNGSLTIYFLLVLLPLEQNSVLKKGGGKRYLIMFFDHSSGKVVFILMAEVIALYIGLTAIQIRKSGF